MERLLLNMVENIVAKEEIVHLFLRYNIFKSYLIQLCMALGSVAKVMVTIYS